MNRVSACAFEEPPVVLPQGVAGPLELLWLFFLVTQLESVSSCLVVDVFQARIELHHVKIHLEAASTHNSEEQNR